MGMRRQLTLIHQTFFRLMGELDWVFNRQNMFGIRIVNKVNHRSQRR
jgi:hypothetical protein